MIPVELEKELSTSQYTNDDVDAMFKLLDIAERLHLRVEYDPNMLITYFRDFNHQCLVHLDDDPAISFDSIVTVNHDYHQYGITLGLTLHTKPTQNSPYDGDDPEPYERYNFERDRKSVGKILLDGLTGDIYANQQTHDIKLTCVDFSKLESLLTDCMKQLDQIEIQWEAAQVQYSDKLLKMKLDSMED